MKRLAIITVLLLCSCFAAFAQWGDDAWKVEKVVEMPGVSKNELYKRAYNTLWNHRQDETDRVLKSYGDYYNWSLKTYQFHLELNTPEKKYVFNPLSYDFAIFCEEGRYRVVITGIIAHPNRGPSIMRIPLDNSNSSRKTAAEYDAIRNYLTDELDWLLPTIKREMSTSI